MLFALIYLYMLSPTALHLFVVSVTHHQSPVIRHLSALSVALHPSLSTMQQIPCLTLLHSSDILRTLLTGCFDTSKNINFTHSRTYWQPLLNFGLKDAFVSPPGMCGWSVLCCVVLWMSFMVLCCVLRALCCVVFCCV